VRPHPATGLCRIEHGERIVHIADPDLPSFQPQSFQLEPETLVVRIINIAGTPPSTHHRKKDSRGKKPLPI
jgi:hypothetical protein